MNLVTFCFRADWAVWAVLKFYAILVKYPNFESFIFHFSIRVFVHCRVRTKNLIKAQIF